MASPQIDSSVVASLLPHGYIASGLLYRMRSNDPSAQFASDQFEVFDAWYESPDEKRLLSQAIAERFRLNVEKYFRTVPEHCRQLRVRALSNLPDLDERSWEKLNLRRLDLIDKDINTGLTPPEKAELDDLERKADDYLNEVAPLPWGIFEKLREAAAEAGVTIELD